MPLVDILTVLGDPSMLTIPLLVTEEEVLFAEAREWDERYETRL